MISLYGVRTDALLRWSSRRAGSGSLTARSGTDCVRRCSTRWRAAFPTCCSSRRNWGYEARGTEESLALTREMGGCWRGIPDGPRPGGRTSDQKSFQAKRFPEASITLPPELWGSAQSFVGRHTVNNGAKQ